MTAVPLNGDVLLKDTSLLVNNTFDVDALVKTLERYAVQNYSDLYHVQRTKVGIESFTLDFSEFKNETRRYGQTKLQAYPKRYIAYIRYTFVPATNRHAYRRSELYNKDLDQKTISENTVLFPRNFMIFIGGEFVTTCEIQPLEDKLAIIVDVATRSHPNGISYETWAKYTKENPKVQVFIVPNYKMSTVTTTVATVKKFDGKIPFRNIPSLDVSLFEEGTPFIFTNTSKDFTVGRLVSTTQLDLKEGVFKIDQTKIGESAKNVRFTIINFNEDYLYDIVTVDDLTNYFVVDTQMPCATENMIPFTLNEDGTYTSNHMITFSKFYPNIYRADNLMVGQSAIVLIFYSDYWISDNEEYINDLAYYSRFYDLLEHHITGSNPDIVRDYMPEPYDYSIEDYKSSVYMPHTMNYKIGKLRETIPKYPDILRSYMEFLNLPLEKYYVKMEKLDLDSRLREDTLEEYLNETEDDVIFNEPHYVFSMNCHFLRNGNYAFRLFLDGLFLKKDEYTIKDGPDFYYIYIPASRIFKDSILEIEKYRLYNHFENVTFQSLDDVIEFNTHAEQIVPAREIFAYEKETLLYIPKTAYKVFYYSSYTSDWIEINRERDGAFNISGQQIRIQLTSKKYIGVPLVIGVDQDEVMVTGQIFNEDDVNPMLANIPYTTVHILNFAQYDKESYRVFNNGRFCVPIQYYIKSSTTYGGVDVVRTKAKIFTGDQFTVDRVPGYYRVVYFKKSIEERGYVDLDGKIPLPFSLKYYDVYLNGLRLNDSHVEIVSPTKFYLKNVNSTKNLIIMERSHDDDVLYLTSFAYKKAGYSESIMDTIFRTLDDVKEAIDLAHDVIEDTERDALEGGVLSDETLIHVIIYEEILKYHHLNSNVYSKMLRKIRTLYPQTIVNGVYAINGNLNPSAPVIKLVDCNAKFKKEGV